MFNFSELSLGDTIYNITDNLHTFSRKKIFKVDKDGVEWFRYDKPTRTFGLDIFTYVGRAESHIIGYVSLEDVDETKYFIETKDQKGMTYIYDIDVNSNDWFASKEEADAEVSRRTDEQSKVDRG